MNVKLLVRWPGAILGLLPLTLLASGCVAAYDHDSRAGQGPDYARQIFSLYDEPNGAPQAAALHFPLSIAVAEVGELGPPPVVLDELRKEPALCRRVEGIPGIANGDYLTSPYNVRDYPVASPTGRDDAVVAAAAMRRMLRLARDMGMSHLMLFGATVDSDVHATGLSGLDLTIVGAFIIPSRDITGRARASAVLIDLRTDRIVLSAGTEADAKRAVSAADQAVGEDHLIKQLRDEAFGTLGSQMIARCKAASLPSAGQAPAVGGVTDAPGGTDPFAGSASMLSPNSKAVLGDPGGFVPHAPDPVPVARP
jgi:hypothetical protein